MSDLARKDPPVDRASAEGDLERLFTRCQDELLGTLFYLVGNIEDARDALQETFVKCWRHRAKMPEILNPRAWIFRVAVNTGRDLRQTAWRRKRQALTDEKSHLECHQKSPHELLERGEDFARLASALQDLRDEEKEVFLLRQNGELTYEEIGQALEVPTGTVKTRMRLALGKLREVLQEQPE